jgi:hypothetical protein
MKSVMLMVDCCEVVAVDPEDAAEGAAVEAARWVELSGSSSIRGCQANA